MYRMDGKLFDTPEKAIQNREDELGWAMDEMLKDVGIMWGPGQRLKLHQGLIFHRKKLSKLLDY